MAEQIDSLFVRLGLEQDQQSFDQAEDSFESLKGTALQLGAVIGGGMGLKELTADFADSVNEANKLAEVYRGLGSTPQFIGDLRGAFRLIDEDASEASDTIKQVADLIEQTKWGEIPEDAIKKGFDPTLLQNVDSAAEGINRINELAKDMEPEKARRLLSSLGFGDAQIRLLAHTDVAQQMQRARELNPHTEKMSEDSAAFERGFNELHMAIDGVTNKLSETFVGGLGEGMSTLADVLKDSRENIATFTEVTLPQLKDGPIGIGALVALRDARSDQGILSKIPFANTAVAAAGGIAFGVAQNAEYGEDGGSEGIVNREPTEWLSEEQRRRRLRREMSHGEPVGGQGPSTGGGPPQRQAPTLPETKGPERFPQFKMGGDTNIENNVNVAVPLEGMTESQRQRLKKDMREIMQEASENAAEDLGSEVK